MSGWDSNDNEEYSALWPSPPMTLIQGDNMHPPQLTVCRQHPSQGWMVNTIGMTHYYRLLIRDPSTGKNIVAPFILYTINRLLPTISGLYGQGYPIKTHPLTATQIDYATKVITAEQQALFYSDASFAPTIDHIMDKFCPNDLAAAICQYHFFKETQYAIQAFIKKLQEKEMQYVEKGVEVLSDLENANTLGHIFAHKHDITQYALEHLTPSTYIAYCKIHKLFTSDVTHSVTNVRIQMCQPHHPRITYAPRQALWRYYKDEHATRKQAAQEEQAICNHLYAAPMPKHRCCNIPLHVHACKCCHSCHE